MSGGRPIGKNFQQRRHTKRIQRPGTRLLVEQLEARVLLATLPTGFSETAVASGLSNATAMELAPNGDLWVLEQAGAVKRFRAGSTTADIVGNVSGLGLDPSGERGLLGIAFAPNYTANKQVFLYYTATTPNAHNRIARFAVNDTSATDYYFAGTSTVPADMGSSGTPAQTIILDLDQLSTATNHNGGAIHFGPDGKLYAAVGENANPANSQTLNNLLGKMLRINGDGTIPSDNPFLSSTTGKNQAIWALGLRNPFTFTFQPGSGRMFINDVGQNTLEEIDDGIAGSNYGWPATEGDQGTPPSGPGAYRPPLYVYSHGSGTFQGFAITGGAFYNPTTPQFPASFAGDYFFADFVNSWIQVFDVGTNAVTQFATGAGNPVDLRVANDGSLLYLARGAGQVFRVTFATSVSSAQIVDNGDAGFSTTAGWTFFANQGYQSDVTYSAAGTGSEVATWNFPGLASGQYRVSATWSSYANRATDAPYQVLDGSAPLATVRVNQQQDPNDFNDAGAGWEDLGTFIITGSTLTVRLTNAVNQYVIADAIRVEQVGTTSPAPEIQVLDGGSDISDNTGSVSFGTTSPGLPVSKTFTVRNLGSQDLTIGTITVPAGFTITNPPATTTIAPAASTTFTVRLDANATGSYSGMLSFGTNDTDENPFNFTISGSVALVQIQDNGDAGFSTTAGWTPFSSQGYQNDVTYAAAGSGSETASWNFTGLASGQYRVSATWFAYANRATNAPYQIFDGSTPLATVRVNQQQPPNDFNDAGGAWEDLGTFSISGQALTVRLTNAANGFVIADAIRVEKVGAASPAPEIQVLESGADIADNAGSVSFGSTTPGAPVSKTFTVRNLGSQDLTIGSISVPAGFTLTNPPGSTTLAPAASTTFTVRLDANATGTFSGPLSFATNDSDENPFNFTVSGAVALVQIKDNGDAGFSTTPGWTFFPNQGYQNDDAYVAAGTGSEVATWNFTGLTSGQYRISATWFAYANRATNAPFQILDGATPLRTVQINQQQAPNDFSDAGGVWEDLGTFTITGPTLSIRLTNAANGFVIADAIRIEQL